jgi:DNA-binding Lrp family transcriptional regulator
MAEIDAIDRRILAVLRRDGRMPNVQLAGEVGLSPSACLRRLHAMETSGVIRGYTVLVDEPDTGDESVVIVQITLERLTEDAIRKFETEVRKCPEVRQCYLMTGIADYLLHVSVKSPRDYERIHTEVFSRLPGVSRIQSSFAIRSVISQGRKG